MFRGRMKKTGAAYVALTLATLFVVYFAACGADEPPASAAPAPVTETPEPEPQQVAIAPEQIPPALVAFLTGDVFRRFVPEDAWAYVDIGDELEVGETIRVDEGAYAELQFGDFAVVRIDGNTQLRLEDIVYSSDRNRVALDVARGSVMSRVDQISGGDRFRVRTPSAVAGVRGTSFEVRTTEAGETEVAVRSGRVAVVPPAVAEMEDRAEQEQDPEVRAELQRYVTEIEETSMVEEAQEATVDVAALQAVEQRVRAVQQSIDEAEAGIPVEATVEERRELRRSAVQERVSEARVEAEREPAPAPIQTRPASQERLQRIEQVDRIQMVPLAEIAMRPAPAPEPEPAPAPEPEPEPEPAPPAAEPAPTPPAPAPQPAPPAPAPAPAPAARPEPAPAPAPEPEPEPAPEPIERRVQVSSGPLVGLSVSNAGVVVSSDRAGTLRAHSSGVNQLWSVNTNNTPNENSIPVVHNDRVYFSGAREFVVVNLSNGNVILRQSLDSAEAHLFGRRVIPAGNELLYPANNELRVLSRDGAVQRSIALPSTAGMSPVVSNGRVVLADNQGEVIVLGLTDGAVQQRISSSAVQPVAHAPAVEGNTVFLAGRRGNAAAVDISSATVRWSRDLEEGGNVGVFTDPVLSATGVFFYGGGRVFALSKANGQNLFAPVPNVTTPPLIHGTTLAYGTGNTFVVATAANGSVRHRVPIAATATGRPVFDGQFYYVGTQGGELLILNPEGF